MSRHHRLTSDAGGKTLSISTKAEGPKDKVYGLTHEYRATFDVRRRGVVTRVETEDVTGFPAGRDSRHDRADCSGGSRRAIGGRIRRGGRTATSMLSRPTS